MRDMTHERHDLYMSDVYSLFARMENDHVSMHLTSSFPGTCLFCVCTHVTHKRHDSWETRLTHVRCLFFVCAHGEWNEYCCETLWCCCCVPLSWEKVVSLLKRGIQFQARSRLLNACETLWCCCSLPLSFLRRGSHFCWKEAFSLLFSSSIAPFKCCETLWCCCALPLFLCLK